MTSIGHAYKKSFQEDQNHISADFRIAPLRKIQPAKKANKKTRAKQQQ